jgi:murein DD-endopeptidase MepM/ murein hydrolase activator NlpD
LAQLVKPNFQKPMDLPIEVAGNFMELRTNHFHSGLDMKTNGRIGQPVMAVADGWVSRIKVSPWGYGKAIYIDHPTGYTTVYGHLDRLNGLIANKLLEVQYANRDFSIDQYFKPGDLPVRQGDVIAFSGNTGGSSAPHLHFEVRRTADQHALDPEAYGMNAPDKVRPDMSGLRIYPLDSDSRVAPYPLGYSGFPLVQLNDSTYALKAGTNVAAIGTVGLALNVTDRYSNSSNTCGIRSLQCWVNGKLVTDIQLDEIDFGLQRYANAYMDYGLFKDKDMHYNRCYKLPNNKLDIYGKTAVPGRIKTVQGQDQSVQLVAKDASGNRSVLNFILHGATDKEASAWPVTRPKGTLWRYDAPQVLTLEGMRFSLPAGALFDDTYITTSKKSAPAHALTPLYLVQDELTPLRVSGEISMALDKDHLPAQTSKLLVVRLVNGRPVAEGGTYADGWMSAAVRNFGAYTVMLDTVPPVITPISLGANMSGKAGFKIKVRDDLSGIGQYAGTIDGQWVLMEFEPKGSTLEHVFDVHTYLPGEHEFHLEVTDERGNKSSFTRKFVR